MAEPASAGRPAAARPGVLSLLAGQVHYVNREFWRSPVAAFFTLLFPLSFLVILCAVIGNETVDPRTGVRLAQYLVPVFAVYGVVMASFAALAIATAVAREQGVLKRLRGTPLPPWIHMAGRVGSAIWVSVIAVAILVGVGLAFYGLQIVWAAVPGFLLTLLVGIACSAALGLAVVAVTPSAGAVQAITNAVVIPLAFISDIFVVADLPPWLETIGWVFPLKHFANASLDAFNPYLDDRGFYPDHLAVLLLWAVAGLVVALWRFRWEPRGGTRAQRTRPAAERPDTSIPATAATALAGPGGPGTEPAAHRPATVRLITDQLRQATTGLLRDPMSLFFGVLFPIILLVFFSFIYRDVEWRGVPLPQFLAPVFAVYGVAILTYVDLPQAVVTARQDGVLKRLRGTPLPTWAYLAGRLLSALLVGLATVLATYAVGMVFFGVRVEVGALPGALLVFLVGTACFAALGLLIASTARNVQTVTAVTLGTLLPLAFVSDIFIMSGEMPALLSGIGWFFPLRHWTNAAFAATSPQTVDWTLPWDHLAVLAVWGMLAALLAWRLFRTEPRAGDQAHRSRDRHHPAVAS